MRRASRTTTTAAAVSDTAAAVSRATCIAVTNAVFACSEIVPPRCEATATDPLVRLTAASFAVNGKKWINVFPTDGLFDSKSENFRFKTESLKPGTYVVVLRVRDAAGNTGAADVVFTVQQREAAR